MTACCQTAPSLWPIASRYDPGVSDVAARVQERFKESVHHYLEPWLERLTSEIGEVVADSREAAIPVDRDTAHAALDFALLLPRFTPLPEVSADPDGEISFDWFGPSGKMFSVSINKTGRLSYAGWFREDSRVHGTEKLVDSFPEEILRGLLRATR